MTAIKVDVARLTDRYVVLRPTDLLLENADDRREELEFAARMARILRLWEAAENVDSPLAELVRDLATAIRSHDPDFKAIEQGAQRISDLLQTIGDPLPAIERQLGISEPVQEVRNTADAKQTTARGGFGLEDDVSPHEAIIQRVKQWRLQAQRGSVGRRFSREVASAYEYRCIFSGQKFPRLEATDSPGVDSAHILPWSTHDLDSVRNGLCLNKQCHWAFDQGILRLAFDEPSNTYLVSVPDAVRHAARSAAFDLDYFESMTGPIPASRLPKDQALWPSPKYVAELDRFMGAI
jgi:hypothetical protein